LQGVLIERGPRDYGKQQISVIERIFCCLCRRQGFAESQCEWPTRARWRQLCKGSTSTLTFGVYRFQVRWWCCVPSGAHASASSMQSSLFVCGWSLRELAQRTSGGRAVDFFSRRGGLRSDPWQPAASCTACGNELDFGFVIEFEMIGR
jgi:hypothetical protein